MNLPKGKSFTMVGLDDEMYDALTVAMRQAEVMNIGKRSFACVSAYRIPSGAMRAEFDEIFFVKKPDPQWSGEGRPPVGLEVEFDHNGSPQGKGKVLFYGGLICIIQNTSDGFVREQTGAIED